MSSDPMLSLSVQKVFHCAMAIMEARISHLRGYVAKSPNSTRHLVLALRLLQRDIDDCSRAQDSTVVVAISLAMYANLNGAASESRIHLQGLKCVLGLRPGGLAALCRTSPEVGNKIRRADAELALLAGTPTEFGAAELLPLPQPPHILAPLTSRRVSVLLPSPLDESNPVLRYATADVLTLCSYAGSSQLSPLQYQDIVLSIFQRLIDYAPLGGDRPSNPLDDVYQLGLLAFMSMVLYHNHGRQPTCPTTLSNQFRTRLDRFDKEAVSSSPKKYSSLYFWLMFMCILSMPENEQCRDANSLLHRRIQLLAGKLGLNDWNDVSKCLCVYPWVAALHDVPGRKLWAIICK